MREYENLLTGWGLGQYNIGKVGDMVYREGSTLVHDMAGEDSRGKDEEESTDSKGSRDELASKVGYWGDRLRRIPDRDMGGTARREAVDRLTSIGMRTTEIAKILKIRDTSVSRIKQVNRITPLTHPTLVKRAVKTVRLLVAGKPVGKHKVDILRDGKVETVVVSNDLPTPSVSLSAAREILDRAEPKITKSETLNVDLSHDIVDLSAYATHAICHEGGKQDAQVIDAEEVTELPAYDENPSFLY